MTTGQPKALESQAAVGAGARARLAALTLLLSLAGCDGPGKPNLAQSPLPANRVTDFADLYAHNCSACHGREGKLGPAPPLNDALFLAIVSDDDLQNVVRKGRHGTLMPAFDRNQGGPLTDEQASSLVHGIRKTWGDQKPPIAGRLPVYTAAETALPTSPTARKVAAKTFAEACGVCHGDRGEGGTMGGPINDHAFLTLMSDQALRRIVITGRPDLGMPDYHSDDGRADGFQPLTDNEITTIVALLRSWQKTQDRSGETDPKSAGRSARRIDVTSTSEVEKP